MKTKRGDRGRFGDGRAEIKKKTVLGGGKGTL